MREAALVDSERRFGRELFISRIEIDLYVLPVQRYLVLCKGYITSSQRTYGCVLGHAVLCLNVRFYARMHGDVLEHMGVPLSAQLCTLNVRLCTSNVHYTMQKIYH